MGKGTRQKQRLTYECRVCRIGSCLVTGLANRNYLGATRLAFPAILAFDDVSDDYRGASNSHSHDTLGPPL
jgi:hypothetical protein